MYSRSLIVLLIIILFIPRHFWWNISNWIVALKPNDLTNIFQSTTLYAMLQSVYRVSQKPVLHNQYELLQNKISLATDKDAGDTTTYESSKSSHSIGSNPAVRVEADNSLVVARKYIDSGYLKKARRLLEHAHHLDPNNPEVLYQLGRVIEATWRQEENGSPGIVIVESAARSTDELIMMADLMYTRALISNHAFQDAVDSKERIMSIIEEIDQRKLSAIDNKVRRFYSIPANHVGLRRAKTEHYFSFIYHSNAIEGNTLSFAQTRSILETRLAVGGKSLAEQNEVIGLDFAMRFLNKTLMHNKPIDLEMILELHRQVLAYVDPEEAGRFRRTQVFVADHKPPRADDVPALMDDFVVWLQTTGSRLHPVELAGLVHWKFVFIHPFYDGNGRTARLLTNYILMRAGYPPAIIRLDDRPAYYQALQDANAGDVRPFLRFIAGCTERTVDEYLAAALTSTELQLINSADLAVIHNYPITAPWTMSPKCSPDGGSTDQSLATFDLSLLQNMTGLAVNKSDPGQLNNSELCIPLAG